MQVKLTRIIPARKQTIEICAVNNLPYLYKDWSASAKELGKKVLTSCWWCRKPFNDEDSVTIVVTKCSNSSKWFCASCSELISKKANEKTT